MAGAHIKHAKARTANRMRKVMKKASRKCFIRIEDMEDSVSRIKKIAGKAIREAAAQNRKYKLASIIIRGNEVLKKEPNQKEKVIAVLEDNKKRYKPGQVLYARKG